MDWSRNGESNPGGFLTRKAGDHRYRHGTHRRNRTPIRDLIRGLAPTRHLRTMSMKTVGRAAVTLGVPSGTLRIRTSPSELWFLRITIPRPSVFQADALPSELRNHGARPRISPRSGMVWMAGFEPATPCIQNRYASSALHPVGTPRGNRTPVKWV